jgi:hypothetical protein
MDGGFAASVIELEWVRAHACEFDVNWGSCGGAGSSSADTDGFATLLARCCDGNVPVTFLYCSPLFSRAVQGCTSLN